MTSSLGTGGPSPSELVSAFTKCTRQPSGAASRIRCSSSGRIAHVRDFAFPSTTSSRSFDGSSTRERAPDAASGAMDSKYVLAPQQRLRHDIELTRGTDEPELEDAVLGVIERLLLPH